MWASQRQLSGGNGSAGCRDGPGNELEPALLDADVAQPRATRSLVKTSGEASQEDEARRKNATERSTQDVLYRLPLEGSTTAQSRLVERASRLMEKQGERARGPASILLNRLTFGVTRASNASHALHLSHL
jgi:hypothetical protein